MLCAKVYFLYNKNAGYLFEVNVNLSYSPHGVKVRKCPKIDFLSQPEPNRGTKKAASR